MISINTIIWWLVVTLAITTLIYSTVKIFLISFKYRKKQKENEERIKKLLEEGG